MGWSNISIPPMRSEAWFGDRIVPAFANRPRSIWQMVTDATARCPDGEALVFGDERLTWRETMQRSSAIATGLQALGLRSGDRLALLLDNRIEFVLALFGAAQLGLVTVLLSTRQQKPEIAYVLANCGAKAILHEATLSERLPDPADVPDLIHRVSTGASAGSLSFAQLTAHAPLQDATEVGEQDTALIMYTSGTTGRPKGAMLAHCNIIHSAMIYEACMELTPADRSIAAVPLAHVTGVVANIMAMARCAGAPSSTCLL